MAYMAFLIFNVASEMLLRLWLHTHTQKKNSLVYNVPSHTGLYKNKHERNYTTLKSFGRGKLPLTFLSTKLPLVIGFWL